MTSEINLLHVAYTTSHLGQAGLRGSESCAMNVSSEHVQVRIVLQYYLVVSNAEHALDGLIQMPWLIDWSH